MLKIDRTGEIHITNEGYTIKIINCNGSKSCDVVFEDGTILTKVNYHQIKNGSVKNPYHKSVYGVAYLGTGCYTKHIKKVPTKCYDTWIGMIRRVYKPNIKRPTYKNVTVCEEWHNFQNFAEWFHKNYDEETMKDWHLDKDLLSSDIKIYSPSTCCFIPPCLNTLISKKAKNNSRKTKSGRFQSVVSVNGNNRYLGVFDSKKEADYCSKEYFKKHLMEKIKILKTDLQNVFIKKLIDNEC